MYSKTIKMNIFAVKLLTRLSWTKRSNDKELTWTLGVLGVCISRKEGIDKGDHCWLIPMANTASNTDVKERILLFDLLLRIDIWVLLE